MKSHTIATIASHSCLQILHGAKQEGFATLAIAQPAVASFYQRFSFIDQIIPDRHSYSDPGSDTEIILVPHGSFVAYGILESMKKAANVSSDRIFGNRNVLEIESDRTIQDRWMRKARVDVPRVFTTPDDVDRPVIVKHFGARGGQGYTVAANKKELLQIVTQKRFGPGQSEKYMIQEYIVGTPVYCQYFFSIVRNRLEIMGFDRRYETDVDGIGRIPAALQQTMDINPTFTVIGNLPLVVRESLLPKFYDMGERVVAASKEIAPPGGLWGPFCLETIITPDQRIVVIEISARIVAGTNLYINGSPYTDLLFAEPMSTGRRIAREIKEAMKKKKLTEITT